MIKENKEFFLYILGTIALIIVTVIVLDIATPGVFSNDECGFLGTKCWFSNLTGTTYTYENPPEMDIDTNKDYKAIIKTNVGDIEIDLLEKNAPIAVNNFVFLAQENYYDNVHIHRVIKESLIQTGDRNTLDSDKENDGQGGPGYSFKDEINWGNLDFSNAKIQQLQNLGYSSNTEVTSVHMMNMSIAMANDGPNMNGSQFFIITASSDDPIVKGLEGRHTVFGSVISGFDIVTKIENVEVDDAKSNSPKPKETIYIMDIVIKVS
jgi:cyclophilin family peptidyl-prolyl cis-trans isomerase